MENESSDQWVFYAYLRKQRFGSRDWQCRCAGTPVVLENPSGSAEQLWTLAPVGNTNVLLVNQYSGLAATAQTNDSGAVILQEPVGSSAGQQWMPQPSPTDVSATAGEAQVALSWKLLTGATLYRLSLLNQCPDNSLGHAGTCCAIYQGGDFRFRVKKELESSMEIWQPGFSDHRIRDIEDYRVHVEYVYRNPVGRRLVERAVEYPYCSALPGKFERRGPSVAKATRGGSWYRRT